MSKQSHNKDDDERTSITTSRSRVLRQNGQGPRPFLETMAILVEGIFWNLKLRQLDQEKYAISRV